MNEANDLASQIHQTAALLSRDSDQILQEQLGIGLAQYKILSAVENHPVMQQKSIAKQVGQTEASITRQVKLLQRKGMLSVEKNPANRREHVLRLTTKGTKITATAQNILASYHADFFSSVSNSQQHRIIETLQNI